MNRARARRHLISLFFLSALVSVDTFAQQGAVTGDQKTLVIVGNFTDSAVTCSISSIRSLMFDPTLSLAALLKDNSLGKVTVSGDVVGPYTINRTSTDPCNLSGLSSAAEAAATASGVDVSAYPHRMYVLPPNTCSGGGNGTMGGLPSYSWIYGCGIAGTYVHNFGHNLGLDHAATAGPLGDNEYNDASDPMAWTDNTFRGLNAPHRHQLGWLDPNNVAVVTQDGSFNIAPLGVDPVLAGGLQVVMIAKPDTKDYYYLSYRRPIGFDKYIDGLSYDLLSVHQYKGDGSSSKTYLLARLNDGESYVDSVNGITVTLVSHSTTFASARVQFAATTCTAGSHWLAVQPQSHSAKAGSSVAYSMTLTNADTSACPTTTFALNRALPAGWSGNVSPSSLTLGPGASGQATLTMTSTSTTTSGNYTGTITASDTAAGHAAAASVIYTVPSTLDTSAPTTPLDLWATVRQKQVALTWSPSSDNVRVAGYRVSRNGVVVGTSTTASWTDASVRAGAAYTYTVVAYDGAGNVSTASGSITIVVPRSGKTK